MCGGLLLRDLWRKGSFYRWVRAPDLEFQGFCDFGFKALGFWGVQGSRKRFLKCQDMFVEEGLGFGVEALRFPCSGPGPEKHV